MIWKYIRKYFNLFLIYEKKNELYLKMQFTLIDSIHCNR